MAIKTSTGLDIGTHSIKIVELEVGKGKYKLLTALSTPTPPQGMDSENLLDQETMANSIKNLVVDSKVINKEVKLALPESSVFTRVIEMPSLSEKELASAIRWEAEQYIPRPLDEVNMDYQVLQTGESGSGKKMSVLLVAAPLKTIEKYTKILEMAALTPVSLETEITAVFRAFSSQIPQDSAVLVANIGARSTDFTIIFGDLILFTRSIPTAGEAIGRAISENFGFTKERADEFKKTYGLDRKKLQGKVFLSIKPVVDTIVNELKRGLVFYNEKNPGKEVSSIILCGGSARLPGLVVYLAENLGIETQIGNPWINFEKKENLNLNFERDVPLYTVATGLAIRS